MKQFWSHRILSVFSLAASFNLLANSPNLPGINALIEAHNRSNKTKLTPDNISLLYNNIVAQGKKHPDALELSNILRVQGPLKELELDPQVQEESVKALVVLHSLQGKMNSESPAFLYGAAFSKATEEILTRTRIQSEINSESVFSTDNSISIKKLRQSIADAVASNLTAERLDRVNNGNASSTDFFDSSKAEIIKERVDRFSAIKEMLLGNKKVNSSSFEKVMELEKLLSQSLVANPNLKAAETIPVLKEIVKSLARSPLNVSLNEEERIIGQEILLKEIISMIQNKEIKSPEELQALASISQVVNDKLLSNLRFRELFSTPNSFKNWLLSLVANSDLRKITNSEERANSIVASAEKLIRDEEQKLVINNTNPRSAPPKIHSP